MTIAFAIPVEIVSEANRRDHWAVKRKRVKAQKELAHACCLKEIGRPEAWPGSYRITLTRVMRKGQRTYDGDNLQSGLKAVRDGIARYLGIDDGSKRLLWLYAQEKGGMERGAVIVEIERV